MKDTPTSDWDDVSSDSDRRDRLDGAVKIFGWMTREELEWLHSLASNSELVIEFGSWHGRSTLALTAATQVIAIDAWTLEGGLKYCQEILEHGIPFERFAENLAPEIATGKVIPYVVNLRSEIMMNVIYERHEATADVVFIDADHRVDAVLEDIRHARALCRKGGIICGHDYNEPDWPGVTEAVDQVYPNASRGSGSIWWTKHE
jgi:predicted O-methyltransferase YrrM